MEEAEEAATDLSSADEALISENPDEMAEGEMAEGEMAEGEMTSEEPEVSL